MTALTAEYKAANGVISEYHYARPVKLRVAVRVQKPHILNGTNQIKLEMTYMPSSIPLPITASETSDSQEYYLGPTGSVQTRFGSFIVDVPAKGTLYIEAKDIHGNKYPVDLLQEKCDERYLKYATPVATYGANPGTYLFRLRTPSPFCCVKVKLVEDDTVTPELGVPEPCDISVAAVTGIKDQTYTFYAIKQSPVVKVDSVTLKVGTDYTVSYKNNKNAGTATVIITGKGNYIGTIEKTFKINKAANPLKISGLTGKISYSKVKSSDQMLAVSKVIKTAKKGVGTLTYAKASGNSKITIAKKTGKVTVKKGLKKGTYTVKVKVKAAGNANYKAGSKSVTVTVKVK